MDWLGEGVSSALGEWVPLGLPEEPDRGVGFSGEVDALLAPYAAERAKGTDRIKREGRAMT